MAGLSDAAARRLLAAALTGDAEPVAHGMTRIGSSHPPMLLIYLLLTIPAGRRVTVQGGGRLGIGIVDRGAGGLAVLSVRSPWASGGDRQRTRTRWRLDGYGSGERRRRARVAARRTGASCGGRGAIAAADRVRVRRAAAAAVHLERLSPSGRARRPRAADPRPADPGPAESDLHRVTNPTPDAEPRHVVQGMSCMAWRGSRSASDLSRHARRDRPARHVVIAPPGMS